MSTNDRVCCAERRLIASKVRDAERHGVPRNATVHWVRRKFGKDMTVWRYTKDDGVTREFGCCVPCVMCRRTLLDFQMRMHVVTRDGQWFHGMLTDEGAPASKFTRAQRMLREIK